MKIRIGVVPYHVSLDTSVGNAQREWRTREGLFVFATDEDATVGVGEAAPLPGHSPDGLEEVRRALLATAEIELYDLDGPCISAAVASTVARDLPSATFALETAILDLVARRRSQPMWALLGGAARPSALRLAPLVSDAASAAAVREAGADTVKLKIRPATLDRDLELASTLVASGLRVRLDANRSLDVATARSRLRGDFEYVEEPVPTSELLGLVGSGIRLALDETLADPRALHALEPSFGALGVTAFVLKPTVLGLTRARSLAERAGSLGASVVLSHSFEGPVALAAAAALALALRTPAACGLAAHPVLRAWPELRVPGLGAARFEPTDAPGHGVDPAGLAP